MTIRRLLAASLVLAAGAAEAQPRNGTLQFQPTRPSPAVTAYGYYVGPFWGTVTSDPTRPKIDLYCVDVLNSISWGHNWSANFTNLGSGDLSLTRHGNAKLAQYQQAAYLASLFNTSGVTTTQWGGIQTAMWNLLNPGNPNGGTSTTNNTQEAYWLAQASTWYATGGANNFDFSKWTIVTDVNATGVVSGRGTQEFLTTGITPEPETWVLMGTGVLLIVGFAVRRGSLV
jgi:hypothetical protein